MAKEAQLLKLGESLSVPSVQEMVQQTNITEIPPRYVRDDQESIIVPDANCSVEVPVINMERLVSDEFMESELKKFHYACKEWGFFQLINHGVSSSLLEKVKSEMEGFFDLPKDEKKKYEQRSGDVEGFGQAFVVSKEQKLDWADLFFMITLPAHLRKPHLFPMFPLPLRDTMEVYSAELKSLAMKILKLMATALKMDFEDMRLLFEKGLQTMRMNYYPPCLQPEMVLGLTPHSDAAALTILLQINEMEGLQIRKDDKWVPVKPLPNAFVINIGDILEIVTNGAYRSIEHRAVVNSVEKRLSLATFLSPNLDGDMGPAPSVVTQQTPALFKRIGVADYLRQFFSQELKGKSFLQVMRMQNDVL